MHRRAPRRGAWIPLATFLLAGLAASARAQSTRPSIDDVRVGFQGFLRPGVWTPITVRTRGGEAPVRGSLDIITPDSDGLNTRLSQDAFLGAGERRDFFHSVMVASTSAEIEAVLVDAGAGPVANKLVRLDDGTLSVLTPAQHLIVSLGQAAGLAEALDDPSAAVRLPVAARVGPEDLPVQWFAYEAVDVLVIATASANLFDSLDGARASAIQAWVRQGGRLVVSVGRNWQIVADSFIGSLLPARLIGQDAARSPEAVELYANSRVRFEVPAAGLAIAQLDGLAGRVDVEAGGKPLVVTGAAGLGTVTLVAFDVDSAPFAAWGGRGDFWLKLLEVRRDAAAEVDNTATMQFGFFGISDLATLLHNDLENFPDVSVVPFGYVALLIFAYILVIGPLDYFVLRRLGRLELTWITFPAMVLVISAAAYFVAHRLKGNALRINRIEFVDIDAATSTLRGSSFFSLFSPRIARYDLAMEPELCAAGSWADLGQGQRQTDRVAAWLGLPEDAYRGVYGESSVSLLGRRGYSFHDPDATALEQVPVPVWAVKTLRFRWLAKAGPSLELAVRPAESGLSGTLTNHLATPIHDVLVVYGDFVYELPRVEPGEVVDLSRQSARAARDFFGAAAVTAEAAADESRRVGRTALARNLLFSGLMPRKGQELQNDALRELELGGLRAVGKVVALARVPGAAGRLWLNAFPSSGTAPPPVDGKEASETFLRVFTDPLKDPP